MTKQGNNPITVTLGAKVTLSSGTTTQVLEGAFPPVAHTSVSLSLGNTLKNFLENVDVSSQVAVETGGGGGGGLGGILNDILTGIAYNVLESVKLLLGPVLGIVGYTLDNILGQLGISVNQVEVTMLGVDCSSSVLTR
jgi:hypothetical protein